MTPRTFIVRSGHRELRYRAGSPLELFDRLMRSRTWRLHAEIVQSVDRGRAYYLLATVERPGDPESIDAACGAAFAKYRAE